MPLAEHTQQAILDNMRMLYSEYLSLNSYLDATGGYLVGEGIDLTETSELESTKIELSDGQSFFPLINPNALRRIGGGLIKTLDLNANEKHAIYTAFSNSIREAGRYKQTPSPSLDAETRYPTPSEEFAFFLSLFKERLGALTTQEKQTHESTCFSAISSP
jgi:hypothetical protein